MYALKSLRIPAIVLLLLGAGLPGLAGEAPDPEERLSSDDATERIEAIDALADSPDARTARLVGRHLIDPEPAVRKAAAAALGRIGDRKALRPLLVSTRRLKDDPETLAAVAEALGRIRSPAAVDTLAGIAKREMSRNEALTEAAVAALGNIRSREAVEELIGLLGSATPAYTNRTYSYGHPELMRPISDALTNLTGLRLREHAAWADWWRREKRRFRFPEDPAEALKKKVFEDTGFQYSVERPDTERWEFVRDRNGDLTVRYRGPREDSSHATVWISAYHASGSSISTTESLAERYRAALADDFQDTKELELDGHDRLDRERAVFQHVVGMTRKGAIVRLCQWIVKHDEVLYTIRATVSTGSEKRVFEEIDEIVGSFRFLSR